MHLTQLDLRISGRDLSNLPSDPSQHVQRDGESWIVQVHPVSLDDSKDITIEEARKSLPEWTKPSLDIPSDSPRFIALAKKILDKKQNLKEGIVAIRHFVNETMEPNAGIGILRDASEVLNSRQGVCRDYAILTTTLLRAAGIPARLAAGIVTWDGTFYYHAWSEAWDGHRWIGVDSTAEADQISAGHIILAEGNVDTAFAFTFLGKASIEVIDSKH